MNTIFIPQTSFCRLISCLLLAFLLTVLISGCGKSDDPLEADAEPLFLSQTPEDAVIEIGTPATYTFLATGGEGDYTWASELSTSLKSIQFSFVSGGSVATLTYNGGDTQTGVVNITVTDGGGETQTRVLFVELPESNLSLSQQGEDFTIGTAGQIRLDAAGGFGDLSWAIDYSGGLSADAFTFDDATDSALLLYNGETTAPGVITVSVTDELGTTQNLLIGVSGQLNFAADLSVEPGTVNPGGTVVAVFTLTRQDTDQPVAGSGVTFQVTDGPARFIDTDGEEDNLSTGTSPTDSNGTVFVRLLAEEPVESDTVIIKAVADNGASASATFTVEETAGRIEFSGGSPATFVHAGVLPAGEIEWSQSYTLTYLDADGEPIPGAVLVLDTTLTSPSVQSVTLGDGTPLPATIITNDDGTSPFVLNFTVTHDDIPADTERTIGSLVLVGTSGDGDRGSRAILFNVRTEDAEAAEPLEISPSSVTVSDSDVVAFNASGGVPPYQWSLSGSGSLSTSTGTSTVYRASFPAGNAAVIVRDSAGNSFAADISSAAPTGLTLAPTSAAVTAGGITAFTATGGVPPYRWSLTGGGDLTSTTGNSTVYTAPTPATQAVLFLQDSGGNVRTAEISPVASTDLSVSPATETVSGGDVVIFTVSGGVAPYQWTLNGGGSISTGTGPSTVYNAPTPAVNATIAVEDATGNTFIAVVAPESPSALFLSPNSATISSGGIVAFTASGGVPPYTWKLTGGGSLSNDEGTSTIYTASAPAEQAILSLSDSVGNVRTADIIPAQVASLSVSPASATVSDNGVVAFTASGGTPPYQWSVSNGGAVEPLTGRSTVYTAPAPATETILFLEDSAGNIRLVDIMPTAAPGLAITPTAVTVSGGDVVAFTVSGGVPPYTWSLTGGGSITTTTGTSTVYTAPTPAVSAVVLVEDSTGDSFSADISPAAQTPLSISPNSVTVSGNGLVPFTASGGVPPYTWEVKAGGGQLTNTTGTSTVYRAPAPAENAVLALEDSIGNVQVARILPTAANLSAVPSSATAEAGELIGFAARSGTPPYQWTLTGNGCFVSSGDTVNCIGNSVTGNVALYRADPAGAGEAVIFLTDSAENATVIDITPVP